MEYESIRESVELLAKSNLDTRDLNRYVFSKWKPDKENNIDFEMLKNLVTSEEIGKNWLFLQGGPGCGKTYAAVIACQIALLQEKRVYFSTVTDLLSDLRPHELDKSQSEITLRRCKNADVLVFDDIGHEKSSEWVREQLYMIINHRWRKGLCTIFTSNFPIENLKTTVSEAVYSRVKGDCLEVPLLEPDLRQK